MSSVSYRLAKHVRCQARSVDSVPQGMLVSVSRVVLYYRQYRPKDLYCRMKVSSYQDVNRGVPRGSTTRLTPRGDEECGSRGLNIFGHCIVKPRPVL